MIRVFWVENVTWLPYMTDFTPTASTDIADFIGRWCDADGGERANYQLFLTELCQLLALPQPDPAGATTPLPDKPAEQAEAEEELLIRLVALNAERAAEEAQGHVRWLRPEYQAPDSVQASTKLNLGDETTTAIAPAAKQNWPKAMPDQVAVIRDLLATAPRSIDLLAEQFKRKPIKSIEPVLAAMQVLGHATQSAGQWRLV